MRIKTYKIDAVHPVAKRVIKSNLNEGEANKLFKELRNAGYEDENIEVIFTEVPLIETPDDILDDEEKVIKYFMLENDMSEKNTMIYLKPVLDAMKKAECIFHQPHIY